MGLDNIGLWVDTVNWLEIVINVFAIIVMPLLVAAVGAKSISTLWKYINAVRFAFDDTSDPAVRWLAKQLGISNEEALEILNRILDIIQNGSVDEDAVSERVAEKILEQISSS